MLNIDFPVLNKKETKKNVLKALSKYRLYVYSISEKDRKSIEEGNLVTEKKMERYLYVKGFEEAIENTLNTTEKWIIREGYIKSDEHNWVKMSQMLNLSKTPYYKKRDNAFYRLAYAMAIEVEE
ncbi:ArpU family transcriptional regulator [Bacillus bombysepticus]